MDNQIIVREIIWLNKFGHRNNKIVSKLFVWIQTLNHVREAYRPSSRKFFGVWSRTLTHGIVAGKFEFCNVQYDKHNL